jgi:hypothetical protein
MASISKMLKPARDNSRMDTAMAEKESRVPTIHRTTRGILLLATMNAPDFCGRAV